MRIRVFALVCILLIGFMAARAQEGPMDPASPNGFTAGEIIRKFAEKEKEFKLAREQYTYRQTVVVQTLMDEKVDGEYRETFDIIFDNKGKRIENVVYAPVPTLVRVSLSQEDLDDIRNRLPFVLTSDEIPDYNILYAGTQRVDELDTYVFDLAPKKIDKGRRYFQGRIWVDTTDLQIVKTFGKTVPDIRGGKRQENLFPSFTTYREQIDGTYWFPTYTIADDTLQFSSGSVRIREIVTYTNYKRFGSDTKITFGDEVVPENEKGGVPPEK